MKKKKKDLLIESSSLLLDGSRKKFCPTARDVAERGLIDQRTQPNAKHGSFPVGLGQSYEKASGKQKGEPNFLYKFGDRLYICMTYLLYNLHPT